MKTNFAYFETLFDNQILILRYIVTQKLFKTLSKLSKFLFFIEIDSSSRFEKKKNIWRKGSFIIPIIFQSLNYF